MRILPGLLISLVALFTLLWLVDERQVYLALRQADYRYIIPILMGYLVALAARAMAWRALLYEQAPFRQVFYLLNAGYLLNNILPLRLGEIGSAFLLGRRGLGFWRVLSTILVERALDMVIVAGLLLGTLPFVFGAQGAERAALVVLVVVLVGLSGMFLLARLHHKVIETFEKASIRWPRLRRIGKERLGSFLTGLTALTDLGRFGRVLVWLASSWTLAIGINFLLMRAFFPTAEFLWAAFGLSVAALGIALPSSPAFVGVLEAAWVGALSLFGVQPASALAFAVVNHLLNIVITGVIGMIGLSREGETIGRLYLQVRNARHIT